MGANNIAYNLDME